MDNKSKVKYEQSSEKIELQKNIVSFLYIFNYIFLIIQVFQKNKDNNSSNKNQKINTKNIYSHKNKENKVIFQINNSQNYQNNIQNNKENININNNKKQKQNYHQIKMDIEIEPNASNELILSGSTNYSNNTQFSIESNNINIYNSNAHFYQEKSNNNNNQKINQFENISNNQNNELLPIKNNNNLFNYTFESKEVFLSFAGEYLDEIYMNLLLDEKQLKYKPNFGYMDIQNDINEQMRAILIDWLIEVHFRYKLKNETLFQTVWIIDTYLSYHQITRAKLQLLGIASLLISCKSQEIYYPQLNVFIDITDGAYIKNELLEMENNILKILNFNIVSPTSNDFYNIIAKAFNFDKKEYYLGKYFLESSLVDYNMIKYTSSVIAVSCAYIVMKFFGINNYKYLYTSKVINEENQEKVIKDAAREIYVLIKNLSKSTLKAIKEKYSLNQFLNVAQYCEQ